MLNSSLAFKEYYLEKYNLKDYGTPGELMTDVYSRVVETMAEYYGPEAGMTALEISEDIRVKSILPPS